MQPASRIAELLATIDDSLTCAHRSRRDHRALATLPLWLVAQFPALPEELPLFKLFVLDAPGNGSSSSAVLQVPRGLEAVEPEKMLL